MKIAFFSESTIAMTFIVLFYTFVMFGLLFVKDNVNKTTLKHFSLFNLILILFISALIAHFAIFFKFDLSDMAHLADNPMNVFLGKLYTVEFLLLLIIMSVYFCRNIYGEKLYLRPNKNIGSTVMFMYMIISIVLVIALPMTITFEHGSTVYGGAAFKFSNVASTCAYIPFLFLTIKNIKKVDPIKLFGPLFLAVTFAISDYVSLTTSYNIYEACMAVCLTAIYMTLEKREERLQKDVIATTLDLERATRFKSDFLSNMSHELKTPLNSLLAVSRSLKENENVGSSAKRDIDSIVYSADSLQELIINILTLSKYEQNKLSLNEVVYDIRKEIQTIPFVEKNEIYKMFNNISIEIDNRVPKQLLGCKDYIKIIIDNALAYCSVYDHDGYMGLSISWDNVDEKNEKLLITVTNYEDDLEDIYENIDEISADIYDNDESHKLSLSLACLLCEELDGTIEHSFNNNKCSITFSIPQKESKDSFDLDSISYKGKKCLVVDDTLLNLKVAKRVLDNVGFESDLVSSGSEALEKVKGNKYDIIFLDIMMPSMNGEETLTKLKENESFNTPVIALTADEVADARVKYTEIGFDGYIVKPFTKVDLINEIKDKVEVAK